ncbi:hypothetical protein SAMN04487867_10462 [Vreelandella titanicae]|uniref:hypothetical protein n=1 Tax=Vreelandella titanicae TaxID=664683 RepID=UPI00088F4B84|nr:hypothetical protein [Halomonas titanicae]SDI27868.1 hypothetical protein SAMN04487867_10462 [Halomonas titanicae]
MAEIYANNVRGKLAEPALAADTSLTLQPGHNFIDPGSNWYRATLFRWEFTSEGIREFDHEVVKVTALVGDTLTVERELEGTARAFDPDTPIELRMTAGTASDIEARAGQALMDHGEAENPHGQYVPRAGADLGSNDLKARLTHNNGYFYIGAYNSSYGNGQLRVYWNDTDKQLNMGGAELRSVKVRNADVTGRKPVTDLELVGETDIPGTVFALREDGTSPSFNADVNAQRASGFHYANSGATNKPEGANGHLVWLSLGTAYNKFLFLPQNNANRLFIGGNHGSNWSTPTEVWTTENLDIKVTTDDIEFSDDLMIKKPNPWLTLNSRTGGKIGVEQCAGISLGESGKKGNAVLHLTYTGNGRGHIGMGTVDAETGLPSNEAMELYYQNRDVKFLGRLELPLGVTLAGATNGLKISNSSNGDVEIGNRNTGYTHYHSSTGRHYFYGDIHAQGRHVGDGSRLTNLDAGNIKSGTINFNRVPSTSSRFSTSTSHALNAAAMNAHRTSGDHDGRYAPASGFDAVGSYVLAQYMVNDRKLRGETVPGSDLCPIFTAQNNGAFVSSSIRVSGTWMCMGRAEGTQLSNVTLWQRIS